MNRRSLFERASTPPPPVPPAADPHIETAPAARPGSAESPLSVKDISALVRQTLEDSFPRSLWLEGELSQVSRARSGHVYLSFREDTVLLEAVAWASDARDFSFLPEAGDRIRAYGRLRAYQGKSRYQFQIQRLEKTGIGALLRELAEREARLEREGLFDPARKQPVPFLPLRIGLLTAVGSDAWADFTRGARARFPGVLISEHHAPVQGSAAPAALAAGIRALGREALDVIVVARGGGSVEDLLPFSDEAVVRAAAVCPVPLVSAIGHEQNRPLLDRVADLRASTPSAAAREILPEREELRGEIEDRRLAAQAARRRFLNGVEERIAAFRSHRATTALPRWLEHERGGRRQDRSAASEAARRTIDAAGTRVETLRRRLHATDPVRRLTGQVEAFGRLRERLARLAPLRAGRERLAALRAGISPEPFRRRLDVERAALDHRRTRRDAAVRHRLEVRGSRATALAGQLDALDPRSVLRRGYSLALDARGRALASSAGVQVRDRLRLLLGEGELGVAVEDIRPPGERGPRSPRTSAREGNAT